MDITISWQIPLVIVTYGANPVKPLFVVRNGAIHLSQARIPSLILYYNGDLLQQLTPLSATLSISWLTTAEGKFETATIYLKVIIIIIIIINY